MHLKLADVPLADAVSSYLFNAQLVTPPDGEMTLVVPAECRETPTVWGWLERHLAGNGPIRRVEVVDVRQSMANGGGPACLRLRVVADPATVDPRFLLSEHKADLIERTVATRWPAQIDPMDLGKESLADAVRNGVEQRVFPTFPVVVGWGKGSPMGAIGSFNPALLVHGQQSVTLHAPIPVEGTATLQSEITAMYDKGKAALIVLEVETKHRGEPLFTNRFSIFG